jgi:hypothetical protein
MRQLMRNCDGSNRGSHPFIGYRPTDADFRSSRNLRARYSHYNGSILAKFAFQQADSQIGGNAYLFVVAQNFRFIPNGNTTAAHRFNVQPLVGRALERGSTG